MDTADQNGSGLGVDLLRCESLLGLDPATCARVLNKNYAYVTGMILIVTRCYGVDAERSNCGCNTTVAAHICYDVMTADNSTVAAISQLELGSETLTVRYNIFY